MGFMKKLASKGVGVVSAAEPGEGVAPVSPDELRSRLLAITGKGIAAEEKDGAIAITWQAKVASAGALGGLTASYRNAYRAISVELDPAKSTATGICLQKDTKAGTALLDFWGYANWTKGQPVGSETMHVVGWLGPHETEGAADEKGFKFSWGDFRHSVIDVVTAAGWTYKPKLV